MLIRFERITLRSKHKNIILYAMIFRYLILLFISILMEILYIYSNYALIMKILY